MLRDVTDRKNEGKDAASGGANDGTERAEARQAKLALLDAAAAERLEALEVEQTRLRHQLARAVAELETAHAAAAAARDVSLREIERRRTVEAENARVEAEYAKLVGKLRELGAAYEALLLDADKRVAAVRAEKAASEEGAYGEQIRLKLGWDDAEQRCARLEAENERIRAEAVAALDAQAAAFEATTVAKLAHSARHFRDRVAPPSSRRRVFAEAAFTVAKKTLGGS